MIVGKALYSILIYKETTRETFVHSVISSFGVMEYWSDGVMKIIGDPIYG